MGRKAERDKRDRRRELEFTATEKRDMQKRSGGVCEACGRKKASQFHHVIGIAVAVMKGFSQENIRSAQNGLHVCPGCHARID